MFELSNKAKDLQARVIEFAKNECLPAEKVFADQLAKATDRWQPVPVMEDLK
jgi:hypothetical protein